MVLDDTPLVRGLFLDALCVPIISILMFVSSLMSLSDRAFATCNVETYLIITGKIPSELNGKGQ